MFVYKNEINQSAPYFLKIYFDDLFAEGFQVSESFVPERCTYFTIMIEITLEVSSAIIAPFWTNFSCFFPSNCD